MPLLGRDYGLAHLPILAGISREPFQPYAHEHPETNITRTCSQVERIAILKAFHTAPNILRSHFFHDSLDAEVQNFVNETHLPSVRPFRGQQASRRDCAKNGGKLS